MKASKNLTAVLASASLIGLIGFAYAQTSGTPPPADTSAQPMQNQPADTAATPAPPATAVTPLTPAAPADQPAAGTGSGSTMGAAGSTPATPSEQPAAGSGSGGSSMGAPGATTNSTGMPTERPAQADRN